MAPLLFQENLCIHQSRAQGLQLNVYNRGLKLLEERTYSGLRIIPTPPQTLFLISQDKVLARYGL